MLPSELWEQATDLHCPLTGKEAMIDMAETLAERVNDRIPLTGWRFQKCGGCAKNNLFHLMAVMVSINDVKLSSIYAKVRDIMSLFDSEVLNATE